MSPFPVNWGPPPAKGQLDRGGENLKHLGVMHTLELAKGTQDSQVLAMLWWKDTSDPAL